MPWLEVIKTGKLTRLARVVIVIASVNHAEIKGKEKRQRKQHARHIVSLK